jgi:hypothetical protein
MEEKQNIEVVSAGEAPELPFIRYVQKDRIACRSGDMQLVNMVITEEEYMKNKHVKYIPSLTNTLI